MKTMFLTLVAIVFATAGYGTDQTRWQCLSEKPDYELAYLVQRADGKFKSVEFDRSVVMKCSNFNPVQHRRDGDQEALCVNSDNSKPGVYTAEIIQPPHSADYKVLTVTVNDPDEQTSWSIRFRCKVKL